MRPTLVYGGSIVGSVKITPSNLESVTVPLVSLGRTAHMSCFAIVEGEDINVVHGKNESLIVMPAERGDEST